MLRSVHLVARLGGIDNHQGGCDGRRWPVVAIQGLCEVSEAMPQGMPAYARAGTRARARTLPLPPLLSGLVAVAAAAGAG